MLLLPPHDHAGGLGAPRMLEQVRVCLTYWLRCSIHWVFIFVHADTYNNHNLASTVLPFKQFTNGSKVLRCQFDIYYLAVALVRYDTCNT